MTKGSSTRTLADLVRPTTTIQFGGKISQRIWDGLGEHEKTYLKFAVKGLGNDNFVAA